jgi:Zn-dependent oligopeptidase
VNSQSSPTTQNKKAHEDALQLWNIAFYSERRREELYSFTDEELRPIFRCEGSDRHVSACRETFCGQNRCGYDTAESMAQRRAIFDVNDAAGKKIAGFFSTLMRARAKNARRLDGCLPPA